MTRTSSPSTKRADPESPRDDSTGERSRFGGVLRKAALVIGVFGLAWVVSRRLRSGDGVPSTDEVRERASEALPDAASELVVGGAADETSDEWTERGAREPDVGAGSRTGPPGIDTETSSVDETMTGEEMAGRVEPDAQDEPAPPGEMNVDEEVAEEVLGDEAGEGDEDEPPAEDVRDEGSIAEEEEMLGQDETDAEGDDESTDDEVEMLGQDETDMESDEDENEQDREPST